jgi:hypothetical protein
MKVEIHRENAELESGVMGAKEASGDRSKSARTPETEEVKEKRRAAAGGMGWGV